MVGKKMVVHVDRVRPLRLKDEQILFDSNKSALNLYGEKEHPVGLSPSGVSNSDEEDKSVKYYPFDHDFNDYIEESDDETAPEAASSASGGPEARVTRGRAGRDNLLVEDYPLPRHCPTSRLYQKNN